MHHCAVAQSVKWVMLCVCGNAVGRLTVLPALPSFCRASAVSRMESCSTLEIMRWGRMVLPFCWEESSPSLSAVSRLCQKCFTAVWNTRLFAWQRHDRVCFCAYFTHRKQEQIDYADRETEHPRDKPRQNRCRLKKKNRNSPCISNCRQRECEKLKMELPQKNIGAKAKSTDTRTHTHTQGFHVSCIPQFLLMWRWCLLVFLQPFWRHSLLPG